MKQLQGKELPGKVELLQIDVSDEASILKAKDVVEEKYGRYVLFLSSASQSLVHVRTSHPIAIQPSLTH